MVINARPLQWSPTLMKALLVLAAVTLATALLGSASGNWLPFLLNAPCWPLVFPPGGAQYELRGTTLTLRTLLYARTFDLHGAALHRDDDGSVTVSWPDGQMLTLHPADPHVLFEMLGERERAPQAAATSNIT